MQLVKAQAESSHYYKDCGDGRIEPAYGLGLREARKTGLYPSITTIEKQSVASQGLDIYRANELAKAFVMNSRYPSESDEDYVERIVKISDAHRNDSADFGSRLHDAIEQYPQITIDATVAPWIDAFGPWHDYNFAEVIASETPVADSRIGVAGKLDRVAVHKQHGKMILDWKTQNIKAGKPAFYPSWCRQLSFYRMAWFLRTGELLPVANVVIDSNKPAEPIMRIWPTDEVETAYRQFLCIAWYWFSSRGKDGYWPSGKWQPTFPFEAVGN